MPEIYARKLHAVYHNSHLYNILRGGLLGAYPTCFEGFGMRVSASLDCNERTSIGVKPYAALQSGLHITIMLYPID